MNSFGPVRLVACVALQFGLCGTLYFLSLVAGAPFWLAAVACGAVCVGLTAWCFHGRGQGQHKKPSLWSPLVLAAGITLLFFNSFTEMEAWGGWDAWAIWNHRAAMLEHPIAWRSAFSPEASAHPDYPLCLPAGIAFLNRLLPWLDDGSVAIAIAWGTTLAIAFLIFSSLARQSILAAGCTLFYLATNARFLHHGLSQYADTLVGLYLLLAVMAYRLVVEKKNADAALVCGIALSLCAWTKNEGAILTALAILFWGRQILSARLGSRFLIGLLPPLAVWVLFKVLLAPPGDMLYDASGEVWLGRLTNTERYALLWQKLHGNVRADYTVPALLLAVYVLIRAKAGTRPSADFGLIIAALLAYSSIYLLTPAPLEWQLDTSLSRLLHQLMPTVVLVCGSELVRLRVLPVEQKSS